MNDDSLLSFVKEDKVLEEYNRLISWYRDLPKGMFVSRLLGGYSFSEPEFEGARQMCFQESLKAYDDFPFGLQAELKRNVSTCRGEKLSKELANYQYTQTGVRNGRGRL